MIQGLTLALFMITIIAQAMRPAWRVEIVLAGAGGALLLSARAGHDVRAVLSELPWDVLVILAALGVVSRILADSHLFVRLAVFGTRVSRASPGALVIGGAVAMFFVSGLVNNITALLLVLPVVIAILELVGTTARHLRWTIGTLLVACNLGGAATPIGDFPAILLLGAGAMEFVDYLALAFPIAVAALCILLLAVHFVVQPARDVDAPALRRELTVAAVNALHRRIRLDARLLLPGVAVLAGMLMAWIVMPANETPPHLIAWIGAAVAIVLVAGRAKSVLLRGVDVESTLFLFGLFVLVGVVRESGFFSELASSLENMPVSDDIRLFVLVAVTGVATGLFSAGPSMAAMLEVGRPLTDSITPAAVYVGLAFGVCAGSSLLLTAATAGPLAQSLIDRAQISGPQGERLRFGFYSFLPVGILSFIIILGTGLAAVSLL